ncbi:MAG: flavodoxin family protein [Desulfobacteraceae bacterium]|nr:flavodoxin family protein [Desulfobacteraceae bacterium]
MTTIKVHGTMKRILAIYGSPRKKGNTAILLGSAVQGAAESGALVEEVLLRDCKISPCLELYACKDTGRCAINDDFQELHAKMLTCDALMLASPIFFYTVSAQTKIFMDRCQAQWARKYLFEGASFGLREPVRKALFISAGATGGARLFDGTLLTMKYFLDIFDMKLWKSLLYRRLDGAEDILSHPEYIEEAYQAGSELARIA